MRRPSLSPPAAEVHCHDRDRFVAALFAPADRREDLLALYAFAVALSQAGEMVREPLAGHIRLQWWRDVVVRIEERNGPDVVQGYPVAEAMTTAVKRHRLEIAALLALIDAHAGILPSHPFADTSALMAHVTATATLLTRLSLTILGTVEEPLATAADEIAVATALIELLRAVPRHVAKGRIVLPLDRLTGVTPESLLAGQRPPSVAMAAAETAAMATNRLQAARCAVRSCPRLSGALRPVLLPAVTATVWLTRLRHSGFDLFDPRHAAPRPPIVRLWLAAQLGRY